MAEEAELTYLRKRIALLKGFNRSSLAFMTAVTLFCIQYFYFSQPVNFDGVHIPLSPSMERSAFDQYIGQIELSWRDTINIFVLAISKLIYLILLPLFFYFAFKRRVLAAVIVIATFHLIILSKDTSGGELLKPALFVPERIAVEVLTDLQKTQNSPWLSKYIEAQLDHSKAHNTAAHYVSLGSQVDIIAGRWLFNATSQMNLPALCTQFNCWTYHQASFAGVITKFVLIVSMILTLLSVILVQTISKNLDFIEASRMNLKARKNP